ncbi:PAS domain S-box-containing protein [Maridesulfovibrio ferrireducens]|uniref:Sensory/regulatory protein RpfC n=1 Tax=Maridesulfovibrio ferrireducens TaxID=246191 RepID=A0A1G9KP47_9BACT|nr:PAS domain S-box protein [Maridesulfovibrio ferrireducens]SDL51356.1 PAS domain S-box-containing protein [Maridesulfovibrio ferrireducens]
MFFNSLSKSRIFKMLKHGMYVVVLSLFFLSVSAKTLYCAQVQDNKKSYAVFSGDKVRSTQNPRSGNVQKTSSGNESSQSKFRNKADPALDFSVLGEVVILLLFVILLIFFWNRKLFKLNQILNEEVAQRRRMESVQSSLYRITLAVTEVSGMEEFYSIVQKHINEFMYARNFYIAFYDQEKDVLSFSYFTEEVEPTPPPRSLANGFTDYVIRTGKPLLADKHKRAELIALGELKVLGVPSVVWLGVPLIHEGRTIGVLAVQSYDESEILDEGDLDILLFLSPYVGIAFDRLQLHEQARLKALALKESEERFRTLFEESSDAVVLIDNELIVQCNRAAYKLLHMNSSSELIGLSSKDVGPEFQPDGSPSLEKSRRIARECLLNGANRFEWTLKKADGEVFPVEGLITPIMYKGKNILHVVWRDITERKKAEEALIEREVKYRALFDYANDAIVLMDLNGNFVSANPEALSMFRCHSEDEFKSLSPVNIMPNVQPDGVSSVVSFAAHIQTALELGSLEYEGVGKRTDEGEFYINVRIRPLIVNGKTLLLGTLRDITEKRASRAEIERSVSLLTATIESSADGILAVDGYGQVVAWNSRFADMWDIPEQLLNDGIVTDIFGFILSLVEIQESASDKIWKFPFESEPDNVDEFILKDGRIIERYSNSQRIGSEVVGRVWSFRDVTDRRKSEKALEESYRRLNDIIEFLPDPTMVVDAEGVLVAWNKAMEDVTGVSKENMVGKGNYEYALPFYGVRKPILLNWAIDAEEAIPSDMYEYVQRKGNVLFGEVYAPKVFGGEGAYFWGVACPLRDASGKIYGGIECLRNVTDRRRVARELNRAKLDAEAATRAKSEFLANMSHEIRTPMNSIIGLGHLVLNSILDTTQRECLEKMMSSADSLLSIIDEILDFSKIEAGKLVLENTEFALDNVLDKLCNLVAIKAEQKGLDFVLSVASDVPHRIIGDPLRLGQILTNLTNNAIKFTKEGEVALLISCVGECHNPSDICLKFIVRDSGIGLSKEEIDELFKSFSQADASTTRKFGGTGLGLAISKSLVNLMGGAISVESQPGLGSSFEFDINFINAETQPCLIMPSSTHGMRVLVIDENSTSREFLGAWLKYLSFDVVLESSTDSGIDRLQSDSAGGAKTDLIIMDCNPLHTDGFEKVALIRSLPDLIDIPIVMMIPVGVGEGVRKQASLSGINGFISKPVTRVSLYQSVKAAFKFDTDLKKDSSVLNNMQNISGVKRRKIKALLVEDNKLNQYVATKMLESFGIGVTVAENGRQALDALWSAPYDIVLMDIQMPEMDGLTATRIIRSDEHYKDLPILAMTAHAMPGDLEKSLEAGMNEHITKPISPITLLDVLKKYIKSTAFSYVPISGGEEQDGIAIPEVPGIDIVKGLSNVGGNKKGYLRVLKGFRHYYGNFADDLKMLIDNSEFEKAAIKIHSLKGVSGNVGAQHLYELCRIIEGEIHEFDEDRMASSLNLFVSELLKIIKGLSVLPGSYKSENNEYINDKDKSFELINELYKLLKEGDADSYDVLEELVTFLDPEQFEGQLKKLTQHIDNLDFDECCLVLEKIAAELGITLRKRS